MHGARQGDTEEILVVGEKKNFFGLEPLENCGVCCPSLAEQNQMLCLNSSARSFLVRASGKFSSRRIFIRSDCRR
jgi:hypothetical protein